MLGMKTAGVGCGGGKHIAGGKAASWAVLHENRGQLQPRVWVPPLLFAATLLCSGLHASAHCKPHSSLPPPPGLAATQVFCQSAARLSDLVRVLMEAFQASTEVQTMHAAAATLGRLVKAGGPLMADIVEEQVGAGWDSVAVCV